MAYSSRRVWLAVLVLLAAIPADAQTLAPAVLRLPNGLTVLAIEDHTLPSVAVDILYNVGSRNERPGITGISHLIEHMMFNGSAHFPPGSFDKTLEAGGGYSNAGTGPDDTEYYEECSSQTLDQVLAMEADRMHALDVDRRNIDQERGIVSSERRERVDDSPEGSLEELLWNTAFVAHPYRWDPIGFMKDIQAIRLSDVRKYYHAHYVPSNAVMAVVGDFRTAGLFAAIKRDFGPIPHGPPQRPVVRDEPTQRGERRANLRHEAGLPAVTSAYHIGSYRNPDDPALDVLSAILSTGESSRLYRSLVHDKRIGTELYCANESRRDPGLFTFYAQAQAGHTAAECEQAITEVLAEVARSGVTQQELRKAKNGLHVAWVEQFTTNIGRAQVLTEYQADWGDWRKYRDYLPLRDRVTAADVQRVARKYFTTRNQTVITLVPVGSAQSSPAPSYGPLR